MKEVASRTIIWQHIRPKRQLIFNELYDVISQNMKIFITTTAKTSNPTTKNNVCAYQRKYFARKVVELSTVLVK
jgi:hypothetical protein